MYVKQLRYSARSMNLAHSNVAARCPGETLKFDARALKFPGKPEADQYLTRTDRDGWKPRP